MRRYKRMDKRFCLWAVSDFDFERVCFSIFGLQTAKYILKLVRIFAAGARIRLQILPSLKLNLLDLASKPKTQHAPDTGTKEGLWEQRPAKRKAPTGLKKTSQFLYIPYPLTSTLQQFNLYFIFFLKKPYICSGF